VRAWKCEKQTKTRRGVMQSANNSVAVGINKEDNNKIKNLLRKPS
jgi:hypothetical protein